MTTKTMDITILFGHLVTFTSQIIKNKYNLIGMTNKINIICLLSPIVG